MIKKVCAQQFLDQRSSGRRHQFALPMLLSVALIADFMLHCIWRKFSIDAPYSADINIDSHQVFKIKMRG